MTTKENLDQTLDLLDEERVLPMPSTFMIAVRRIGAEYGLVEAMESTVPLEDPPA